MSIYLKDCLEKINAIVAASSVGVFMTEGLQEYQPNVYSINARFRFRMGDEECSFRFDLIPQRDRKTEVELEDGKTRVAVPFKLEEEIQVHWNKLSHRKVGRALPVLEFFKAVTLCAGQIQEFLKYEHIVDAFYEMPAPEEHEELDRIASLHGPEALYTSRSGKELREKAEALGLPTSGTKDELRERIFNHAQEEGDASRYNAYSEWVLNRIQPVDPDEMKIVMR